MNLVGLKVKHKSLGAGTVSSQDNEGHIVIDFATKQSKFQYPQAFDTFLISDDESVQAEIHKELDAFKKAEAAKKAAELAEYARKKYLEEEKIREASLEKKYVPVKRMTGQPLTFFVFNGIFFEPESEQGLVWAPLLSAGGFPCFHWDNLMNVHEGDVLFHHADGCIKAISRAKGSYVDWNNPIFEKEQTEYFKGRKVDCEYTILKNPIKTADFRDEIIRYCQVKYAPFDKDGNGNKGYLYDLDAKLAAVFLNGIIEQNPEIAKLDYVQWLIERGTQQV